MNWHYPAFGARVAVGLMAFGAIAACSDDSSITAPVNPPLASARASSPPAPAPLVTVTVNGKSLGLWPYAGTDFSGTPHDPINLIFSGNADPRMLRAALRALDGNRTAFGLPNAAPFNCTWSDAIGNIQVAYAVKREWVGSAMQLECGQYGPIRFHLRFFRQGDWYNTDVRERILEPVGRLNHQGGHGASDV